MRDAAAGGDVGYLGMARAAQKLSALPLEPDVAQNLERRLAEELAELTLQGARRSTRERGLARQR